VNLAFSLVSSSQWWQKGEDKTQNISAGLDFIPKPASSRRSIPPVEVLELFYRTGGAVWGILCIVLMIATAFNFYYAHGAIQFDRHGVETTAKIEDKRVEVKDQTDGTKYIYWVQLSYKSGPRELVVKTKVTSAHYHSIAVGDTVPFKYLKHDPRRFEYPENYYRDWAIYSQIFAFLLGVGWLLATWSAGKWTVHAILARRVGRHHVVTISAIHRVNKKVDEEKDEQKEKYKLLWRDHTGGVGESLPAPLSDFYGYSKGDKIIVFFFKGKTYWRGDVGDRVPRFSPIPRVSRVKH
jgi:hypothetical protein